VAERRSPLERRRRSLPITDEQRTVGRRFLMRRRVQRRKLPDRRGSDSGLVW